MKTNVDVLREQAEAAGLPCRTLAQVTADLANAKKRSKGKNAGLDIAVANIMAKHGRLTANA